MRAQTDTTDYAKLRTGMVWGWISGSEVSSFHLGFAVGCEEEVALVWVSASLAERDCG